MNISEVIEWAKKNPGNQLSRDVLAYRRQFETTARMFYKWMLYEKIEQIENYIKKNKRKKRANNN